MYTSSVFLPLINFKGNSPPDSDNVFDDNEDNPMNEEERRELKQSAATIVIATLAVLLILIVILVINIRDKDLLNYLRSSSGWQSRESSSEENAGER